MLGTGEPLAPADQSWLWQLQRQALEYFLDNQMPNGLVLDRQHNHGPRRSHGWCSTSATGMGLIAIALASKPPHRLITHTAAVERVRAAVRAALEDLPHDHGMMPHFIDSGSRTLCGADRRSTIDSSWLAAGALWAAACLEDAELNNLATRLYDRMDWHYWTAPDCVGSRGLLRHGKGADNAFLGAAWDRCNGETAFMYVLGAGAQDGRCLAPASWLALQPFYGTVAGLRFNNADLGLFVFQYSLDLLALENWEAPGEVDLWKEARLATAANLHACRQAADQFATYRRFWGLSAGDGPASPPEPDRYRCYAPAGPVDGTAHILATLAAIAHAPAPVLENLRAAQHEPGLGAMGRYGFSNINLDRGWVGRDMVGIDMGAAVLALDNFLMNGRVRHVFHSVPTVQRGLERLGFSQRRSTREVAASEASLPARQAS
jgi:hypothetical protein